MPKSNATAPQWPVGLTIKAARPMKRVEQDALMWHGPGVVLELSDGSLLYPSQDAEGNGPGELFYQMADGSDGVLFIREAAPEGGRR